MMENYSSTNYLFLIWLFSSHFDATLYLCRNDDWLLDCGFIFNKKLNFKLMVTLLINVVINILYRFISNWWSFLNISKFT
jgi:hypothetical protein